MCAPFKGKRQFTKPHLHLITNQYDKITKLGLKLRKTLDMKNYCEEWGSFLTPIAAKRLASATKDNFVVHLDRV